jgi:TonB family protein
MIMRHIDRSRSTGGGMAFSFVLHAAVLLMLGVIVGHQATVQDDVDEYMDIAYVEATLGEDVVAKVKAKQKPRPKPEPAGRGVNTDSAFKPKPEASPEPVRPKAKEVASPDLEGTMASIPKLPEAKPKPRMEAPKPAAATPKPVVAKVEAAIPIVQPAAQPKALAQASQLETRTPRPKARQVIDAGKLGQPVKTLQTADTGSPQVAARQNTEAFKPKSGGLTSRTTQAVSGDDVLAQSETTTRRGPAVAEADAVVSAGGNLESAGRNSYRAPAVGLTPSAGKRSGAGTSGVMDVAGPSGSGGAKSGRKTMLDYGTGGGGRGGGLNSRQRIAEPAVNPVVDQPSGDSQPRNAVAEVKLDAKDVNMSITGQIQGRKILQSSPALYTDQARKKGWEGVVAVHFTVMADGRVKDNVYFEQTSVHRDLNQAAMKAIKKFRFAPLGANKAAVEQWGVITIVFKLK